MKLFTSLVRGILLRGAVSGSRSFFAPWQGAAKALAAAVSRRR